MHPSIQSLETGLVYRNSKPHLHSLHAYFPSVAALGNGELLAAMDIGSAFEAVDVRSYVCRSRDGGRTWSRPQLIFRPEEAEVQLSTTCRISAMPDGRLIGATCLFERPDVQEGLSNPATDGFVRTRMALVQSNDRGRSWSGPVVIRPPLPWAHFETCSPVIAGSNGRLLFPTSTWPDWEGQCPPGPHRAIAFLSDDGGETWPRFVDVMDGSAERLSGWEQKVVTLSDGRLLAMCWCYDFKTRQNIPNRYALSGDNGDTFSLPMSSPLHGETCTPVALPENLILCVYRRVDKRGLWAHLARIEGTTWQPLADTPLWGTNVVSHDTRGESILGQMSTLRFGCPSVILLDGNEVFVAFWCVEDCVSNIRWLRLTVK